MFISKQNQIYEIILFLFKIKHFLKILQVQTFLNQWINMYVYKIWKELDLKYKLYKY